MLWQRKRLLVWLLVLYSSVIAAADRHETADPAAAKKNPDFNVQGEYVGEAQTAERRYTIGVQVVARGNHRFDAVYYREGLPGEGWGGSKTLKAAGRTFDGETILIGGTGSAFVKEGVLTLKELSGKTLGTLKKVRRKSPTLGKKPPPEAFVLFDGTSTKHFVNGRRDSRLLRQGTLSRLPFGSCHLHLEFRTPFVLGTKGQDGGNSGVYLQGRYEIQVLESFGDEPTHNRCGGIYSVAPPRVNMSFPPLSWQTYDVEFQAAEYDKDGKRVKDASMTVHHNGVLVHKDVPLKEKTTAAKFDIGPETRPLYIQDHGSEVRYQNIWLIEKR